MHAFPETGESGSAGTHADHAAHGGCPQCLAAPGRSGSAKVAWGIAIIAVLLLLGVLLLGVGSTGGSLLALGSLPLLVLLLCPLMMGAMMIFMHKGGH